MKLVKIIAVVLVLVAAVLIFVAPIGPLPGIFIGGTDATVPENWGDTSTRHEIKLEVHGSIPRVVTVWVIQVDGVLHVVGSNESGWVKMLGDGGPVRVRMDDKTYTLDARRLSTAWQGILTAYADKYRADYPDIVNSFSEPEKAQASAAVFKLSKT
jgi:hypothetical protein